MTDGTARHWSRVVGANVRCIRRAANLTQAELVAKVAAAGFTLHRPCLSRIERGAAATQGSLPSVTVDQLMALAAALDVAPMLLLAGTVAR